MTPDTALFLLTLADALETRCIKSLIATGQQTGEEYVLITKQEALRIAGEARQLAN